MLRAALTALAALALGIPLAATSQAVGGEAAENLGKPPPDNLPGSMSGEDMARLLDRCYRWEQRLSVKQSRACSDLAVLWSSLMSEVRSSDLNAVIDPLAFAIDVLEKLDPDDERLNDIRSIIIANLLSYDRFDNARFYYLALVDSMDRQGRKSDPKMFRAYFHMCGGNIRQDKLVEAERCFADGVAFLNRAASQMEREEADALLMIGLQQLAFAKSRLAKADEVLVLIATLRRGLESGAKIEPGAPFLWALLEGKAHLILQVPEAALTALEQADDVDWQKHRPAPYLKASMFGFRAIALVSMGRFEEARPLFGEATAIYETLPQEHAADRHLIYAAFASALYQQGQAEHAVEIAQAALKITREPATLHILALALIDLDRVDEASDLITAAISEFPKDRPMAALQLATMADDLAYIHITRGDTEAAKAIMSDTPMPDNAPGFAKGNRMIGQAEIAWQEGNPKRAEALGRAGLRLIEAQMAPDHPQVLWGRILVASLLGPDDIVETHRMIAETQTGLLSRIDSYPVFNGSAQAELRRYRPLFVYRVQAAWALAGIPRR